MSCGAIFDRVVRRFVKIQRCSVNELKLGAHLLVTNVCALTRLNFQNNLSDVSIFLVLNLSLQHLLSLMKFWTYHFGKRQLKSCVSSGRMSEKMNRGIQECSKI